MKRIVVLQELQSTSNIKNFNQQDKKTHIKIY